MSVLCFSFGKLLLSNDSHNCAHASKHFARRTFNEYHLVLLKFMPVKLAKGARSLSPVVTPNMAMMQARDHIAQRHL
jgi:hypothetical protein